MDSRRRREREEEEGERGRGGGGGGGMRWSEESYRRKCRKEKK